MGYFDPSYFDPSYFDAGAVPVPDQLIGYGRLTRMEWSLDDQRDSERAASTADAIARGVEHAIKRRRQEARDERDLLALLS